MSASKLKDYQRIITSHDANGKAIILDQYTNGPWQGGIDHGRADFSLSYITTSFPPSLAGGEDLKVYESFLEKPPGIVSNSGTVLRIVDIDPGHKSPMHRTVSLDYGVVIFGEIELELDSGETRRMYPGDICIQRGTMHMWKNVSKTERARMLYFLQPCKPIVVDGKQLGEDYGDTMDGVRPSS